MIHDLVRISLLEPEQAYHVKTACEELQELLVHGTAREISLKEKEVDAHHDKVPIVVAYPAWKRFADLLQKNLPSGSVTIGGFLVHPDVIVACMNEINRLVDDPDLTPVAIIFQRAACKGQWLLQTVSGEDV